MIALDTSVAIPLVVREHQAHARVSAWWGGRDVALAGPAVVETYSVLTRLPGNLRLTPPQAASLMRARFAPPLLVRDRTTRDLATILAGHGIVGGAAYDALVALAAAEHGVHLASRDGRASATYHALGVHVEVVG